MENNKVKAMMSMKIDDDLNLINNLNDHANSLKLMTTQTSWHSDQSQKTLSCWGYWRDHYYPEIMQHSYPVYIQERAQDKGRQAFEIIKMLKDKKFIKLELVGDFIDVMDELIKIL
mgnify:CR=1 FL=1